MLIDLLDRLRGRTIILASASPRRRELLRQIGLEFTVVQSQFPETLDKSTLTPVEYVQQTSRGKALDVLQSHSGADLIISADTVVLLGDRILEKPKSPADAIAMLRSLSGQTHRVLTGVTLVSRRVSQPSEPVIETFHESTTVHFGVLPESVIRAYVESGEPLDKAGSYGIQGLGAQLVKRVDGCFFNVVGLPLFTLAQWIRTLLKEDIAGSGASAEMESGQHE